MTSTLLHTSRHTTPVLMTLNIRTKHNELKLRKRVQNMVGFTKLMKKSLILMENTNKRIHDNFFIKKSYCSRELANQRAALDRGKDDPKCPKIF